MISIVNMDNTTQSLFPNDKAQWFLSFGDQPVGPLKAVDLYEKLTNGEINYLQYIWKEGMTDWVRICDEKTFQISAPVAPTSPPPAPKKNVTPPPPVMKREWFLFFNENQSGPYSVEEAISVAKINSLSLEESFAWREGMAGWSLLSEIDAFKTKLTSNLLPTSTASQVSTHTNAVTEKRTSPRKPLTAKVLITDGAEVVSGVCRDISVGGMQVLSNYAPARVGVSMKINVSPTDESNPQFLPFVAEGIVVRIFEDKRGFSFRFSELHPQTKTILESLIRTAS